MFHIDVKKLFFFPYEFAFSTYLVVEIKENLYIKSNIINIHFITCVKKFWVNVTEKDTVYYNYSVIFNLLIFMFTLIGV